MITEVHLKYEYTERMKVTWRTIYCVEHKSKESCVAILYHSTF